MRAPSITFFPGAEDGISLFSTWTRRSKRTGSTHSWSCSTTNLRPVAEYYDPVVSCTDSSQKSQGDDEGEGDEGLYHEVGETLGEFIPELNGFDWEITVKLKVPVGQGFGISP